jgi:hypothetical protein
MKAMKIASDICVYTNYNLTIEKIEPKPVATENKPSSTTDSNK